MSPSRRESSHPRGHLPPVDAEPRDPSLPTPAEAGVPGRLGIAASEARESVREARESVREVATEARESVREARESVREVATEARESVREVATEARESVREAATEAAEQVREIVREVKPRLRGWLHAGTTPLALAAGVVLVVLSPTLETRVASTLFAGSAVLLFAVSAIFHRGTWTPRTQQRLQRFDHSNIYLLIAGSYTPFALLLLDGASRVTLLSIAWGGALIGVVLKLVWTDAPRWLNAPVYIALGWAAVFYAEQLTSGGVAVTVLIAAGGLLYTVGGLVYGFKWPNPSPRWFGFHEVFHSFTIAAFGCHYVAASLATYRLR